MFQGMEFSVHVEVCAQRWTENGGLVNPQQKVRALLFPVRKEDRCWAYCRLRNLVCLLYVGHIKMEGLIKKNCGCTFDQTWQKDSYECKICQSYCLWI